MSLNHYELFIFIVVGLGEPGYVKRYGFHFGCWLCVILLRNFSVKMTGPDFPFINITNWLQFLLR